MKIRLKSGVAGLNFCFKKGEIIDLPLNEANKYIRAGCAVQVEEIEQPKIKYENAVQINHSADDATNKPIRGEVTSKGSVRGGRKQNKRTR